MTLNDEELVNRYGAYKIMIDGPDRLKHDIIRVNFLQIAMVVEEILPEGRYKDKVHELLEDAAMWANKAIA